ncbi:MAG: UDP-N-acetylmuramate dehydrogenase [candidate division Zixibacteria bacterium]|nr:UDP-N-acetylmuramate dehydrogenase [candidate division Zixibacteria bacterium]NIR62926.1 UDP-N-acetylmuramate dehydrogenase [candidate division Zixibacteria bacterium]NIS16063.1 UDP-N-acetylmuramate dehydrogenase [candidate division Zixibacteria bacterium]NIS44936.1 UDP-N-acetylmuramate dehydrogenase [candidate division Zixibacteria bacterium]NIT52474.1 UDP-N-acetylmuramate dehydrogenase [candidate division Zixibacteria bacterium]
MQNLQAAEINNIIAIFKKRFGENFRENHILADYTTFKIGGPARMFIKCEARDDIIDAVNMAYDNNLRFFIVGGGSNLLISDNGYPGLIIHIANTGIEVTNEYIEAEAGYDWEELVDYSCRNGLGGLVGMAGIKGQVGGAVHGNAGAFGTSVADILIEAEILKPGGEPRWEANKYFAFSYRNSILKKTNEIVLRARFRYVSEKPVVLLKKQDEILELRNQRHPRKDCSAGCFFKNIEKADEPYGKLAAGFLLEKVGAKGMHIGGAGVFEKHANILINASGKARAEDVRKLAEALKKKVKDEYGYNLEEEITFLGD